MTATETPTLMVFAISHYCEKARWALDRLGIAYKVRTLPAGVHVAVLRRAGALRSTVPALVLSDGTVVQGSSEIIDWAEAEAAAGRGNGTALTPLARGVDGAAIERRIGEVAATNVRRWYYSDALFEAPGQVRSLFMRDLQGPERVLMRLGWPALRRLMIVGLKLDHAGGRAAHRVLDAELDWLDGLLAGGETFSDPASGALTRLDITAAALIAPLVLPVHHPVYGDMPRTKQVAADLDAWAERPIVRWCHEIYANARHTDQFSAAA
ncbi:MAG: glutathione S-transferase N-terminal domain-containing protein [Pseudomonadota bacterium]